MSSSHEIVTIQAGNYANFVGTHWWNIQVSIFHLRNALQEICEAKNDC